MRLNMTWQLESITLAPHQLLLDTKCSFRMIQITILNCESFNWSNKMNIVTDSYRSNETITKGIIDLRIYYSIDHVAVATALHYWHHKLQMIPQLNFNHLVSTGSPSWVQFERLSSSLYYHKYGSEVCWGQQKRPIWPWWCPLMESCEYFTCISSISSSKSWSKASVSRSILLFFCENHRRVKYF